MDLKALSENSMMLVSNVGEDGGTMKHNVLIIFFSPKVCMHENTNDAHSYFQLFHI